MQSPKIYFIQNEEGKFYNAVEKIFYNEIVNANYEKNKNVVSMLLREPRFANCKLFTTTEEEYMTELIMITSDMVMAGEYFARKIERYAFKIPTISQVNKTLYTKCKNLIDSLSPFTYMHKDVLKSQEDNVDAIQGNMEEYLMISARVEIYQMDEIVLLLKAYRENRTSILGSAKRILKNKK